MLLRISLKLELLTNQLIFIFLLLLLLSFSTHVESHKYVLMHHPRPGQVGTTIRRVTSICCCPPTERVVLTLYWCKDLTTEGLVHGVFLLPLFAILIPAFKHIIWYKSLSILQFLSGVLKSRILPSKCILHVSLTDQWTPRTLVITTQDFFRSARMSVSSDRHSTSVLVRKI